MDIGIIRKKIMNKIVSVIVFFAVICLFCLTGCPELEILDINEYIVTFDPYGGNFFGDLAFVRIPVYEALTIEYLPVPQKNNNTFDGWYTEVNGLGNEFTNKTRVYSNLIVYASWID